MQVTSSESEGSGHPANGGAKSQTCQGAEHTDSALEHKESPAAHQLSQEQQQELLPAKSSAGQEGTASAPVDLTTQDVDPVSPSD
jgi:hypothetical protein